MNKTKALGQLIDELERLKASIRAKVEHPFRVIKRQFGYVKVRYRGLKKNTAQLFTLFALSNLWMARSNDTGVKCRRLLKRLEMRREMISYKANRRRASRYLTVNASNRRFATSSPLYSHLRFTCADLL